MHFGGVDPVGDRKQSIGSSTFPMIKPLKFHYEGLLVIGVKHVIELEQ